MKKRLRARQRIKELEKSETQHHLTVNNIRAQQFSAEAELKALRKRLIPITVEVLSSDLLEKMQRVDLQECILLNAKEQLIRAIAEHALNKDFIRITKDPCFGRDDWRPDVATTRFEIVILRRN